MKKKMVFLTLSSGQGQENHFLFFFKWDNKISYRDRKTPYPEEAFAVFVESRTFRRVEATIWLTDLPVVEAEGPGALSACWVSGDAGSSGPSVGSALTSFLSSFLKSSGSKASGSMASGSKTSGSMASGSKASGSSGNRAKYQQSV